MNNDPLASALSKMLNAEKIGKRECELSPSSKVLTKILDIMQAKNYIEKYEVVNNGKGGLVKVSLNGRINNCNVIKPRLPVKKDGYEKFEKRHLPAKDFGVIIVTTPKGIMTQNEAKEKGLGGSLLAFVY